jgi:hypothetical protein
LEDPASSLAADVRLLRHLPPPAIVVTQRQWDSLLREAGLTQVVARLEEALAEVEARATVCGSAIGRDLRPAAISFAALARKVARMLWQLAAFTPTTPAELVSPLAALIERTSESLGDVSAWFAGGLAGSRPELPSIAAERDWQMPGVEDPVAATFGVARVELSDHRGTVSDARLLAAYRSRLPELNDICARVVYSVTQPPLDLFALLEPLLDLLDVESPLLAWTTANQTLALIREAADANPARVEAVFKQLRERAAPRAASRERLAGAAATAATAPTEAQRALAELSAYRISLEGLVRPWAWALLRLAGAEGQMPMVTELRDRLAASSQPLHALLGGALIPELRNADAHEEAYFDELRGEIAIAQDHVAPSVVRTANAELTAIGAGLELALACACSQVQAVAEAYTVMPGDPTTAAEALSQAQQRFGHAGLNVWSLRRDRATVQVRLDEIDTLRLSNPCFLATLQANGLLAGVTRWQIGLRGDDNWAIDLPASVLRENWPVFERAARWFPEIPQETFLPCVTWTRLAVEPPGVAMRAAAWIALNDLQHAIEEAEDRNLPDVRWFERRVQNVIGAAAATLRVMPQAEAQPLETALDLARSIRFALAGMTVSRPLEVLIRDVLHERDRLPVPAILPTVDPRPLTVVEADG